MIDLVSVVKELHGLSSDDLNKLLKDSEDLAIHFHSENGLTIKIDVEKLAGFLPLHFLAVLISSDRDDSLLIYLLCGIRLLHSFYDLAARNAKLEQILLDDVTIPEQLLDLVFYLMIFLCECDYREENHDSIYYSLVHSALVASSLYLLIGCISLQWQELVQVLLAHPKVDTFMEASFGAVFVVVGSLQCWLLDHNAGSCMELSEAAGQIVCCLCQHCEASLQFLHSLCQQKTFQEGLLKNQELCHKGGVLLLVAAVLRLEISCNFDGSTWVIAAVSRMKAKALSILLHLCEAENSSYLDQVASSPQSFELGKSVVLGVLDFLKASITTDPIYCSGRSFPMGLLGLNAMRLADVFSDDSNFRSYVTRCFTEVLSAMFCLPNGDFLSIWCSSEFPQKEEDAVLEYDTFVAVGWVLDALSSLDVLDIFNQEILVPSGGMPQATYAHQRTSLFVKVIANLHCFVPNICEEQERNLFLHKFVDCLLIDPSNSLPGFSFPYGGLKAITVCSNLCSLLSHAESLIPSFVNAEDLQLLRVFYNQLQSLSFQGDFEEKQIKPEGSVYLDMFSQLHISDDHQRAQSIGRCSSLSLGEDPSNFDQYRNYTFLGEEDTLYSRNRQVQLADVVENDGNPDSAVTSSSRHSASKTNTPCQVKPTRVHDDEKVEETLEVDNFSSPMVKLDFQKATDIITESGPVENIKNLGTCAQMMGDGLAKASQSTKENIVREVGNNGKIHNMEISDSDMPYKKDEKLAGVMVEDKPANKSECVKESGRTHVDGEKGKNVLEEKQTRKRKRTIMNDYQVMLIEKALLDEPDMQRNAASLQSWADKLSLHGSDITPAQLKNWLNNRKARLARATMDARPPSDTDNVLPVMLGKPRPRHSHDLREIPWDDNTLLSVKALQVSQKMGASKNGDAATSSGQLVDFGVSELVQRERGQCVVLLGGQGEEVGKGTVYQSQGSWFGNCLEDSMCCVVDVIELKADRRTMLPRPSDSTGTSFNDAEIKLGVMRVLWDVTKLLYLL